MYNTPTEKETEDAVWLLWNCRTQLANLRECASELVSDSDVRKAADIAMNFARQRRYEEDAARYAKAGD